ncbi:hypothetical protein [Ruegeria marina]|uniref:Putative acyltransferase ACT14924-like acyltransferase domain-containing protein n=1 Tax=Ruegeria marina TaxID=639004 RepID=A0A1G6Z152_9RHOB|nr:hypothetical protein [Ruegeria marina]SDD95546.1 hypothetical protein SAMN04488239_11246 [Ruegeria marina]
MKLFPGSHRSFRRENPLDPVLQARLHLSQDDRFRLGFVRLCLNAADAVSRLVLRRPFVALRETEDLLDEIAGLTGKPLVEHILDRNGGTTITAHGLDNVPAKGRVIIAATHPTGMFDFVAHAGALLARRPDLKVLANRETERFLGEDSIVPVDIDKTNRAVSASTTFAAMERHLMGEGALLVFGSGRVPFLRNGHLVEPDWRGGTTRISRLCSAPIVPAALDARNTGYYYGLRRFAQFLGGGDDNFGAMVGSLRYAAELMEKLGGSYDVFYARPWPPGARPQELKASAEALVPGLYRTGASQRAQDRQGR